MSKSKKRLVQGFIYQQRKWIEDCESNGISYADGERGEAIRKADRDELTRLEKSLRGGK